MNSKIKKSAGERIFSACNYIFMMFIIIIMVYPVLYVFIASVSEAVLLSANNGLLLLPQGFSLEAYRLMARNPMILRGYANTLMILAAGLIINMLLTSIGAYFLSRKNVLFGKAISLMIIFTMYFSGGLIPFYMTVKQLGMENSLLSLIFPTAVNTFNLIILRTAFAAVPESLEESAMLEGAGHCKVLFNIIIPLSKASIAVILLYYAVAHWNSWFNAMIFLSDRKKFPLQLVLREILIQNDTSSMMQMVSVGESSFIGETVKYAVIVVSIVPILCVYPFLQKYFEKGAMIGAVKG